MQKIINGEQPFQVLSTNFTIGPSESGYDLYFSADGREYSKLFTVAANTNRQVTQVAAGSYYYLEGNTDTAVTVNWIANCYSGGEGGGGSYVLPVASSDTLGGVKIGSGLTMSGDTLSANPGGYTLPTASENVLGGVKIGSGITIDENGVISVSGGTDGPKELVVSLEDLSGMSSSELKAAWDDIYAKYVSGYTVYVEGGVVNKNGYTVRIPLVEAIPETNPEIHSGGWLYFGGIYGDNACYYLSFSSVGNISGNGTGPTNSKKFEAKTVYSLPTASTSTKGGVKVGSGLTIDSEKLSVDIGDGLAFSGNTIVVSGISSNTKVVMLNKLSQQERLDLYNELAALYDYNANGWSSAYTEDMYAFYLDLRSYADQEAAQTADMYEGFYPMECCRMHPTDYGGAAFFTGVEQSREGNGQLICIRFIIDYEGNVDGPSTWWNNPPAEQVSIGPVSFGNDSRGGLTYDADNGYFIYDNNNVATGDTSNYIEDVIDSAYLNSLFNRDGKYDGFRYLINSHVLNVQSSGATSYYTQPSLAKKPIAGYTIGDYTFVWEFTFKYIDYVLKIDAPDEGNIGANLRITQA